MKFLAVCFDIDGTLYPPSQLWRNLLICALERPAFSFCYFKMRKAYRRLQNGRVFSPSLSFPQREAALLAGRGDLLCRDEAGPLFAKDPNLAAWLSRLADFHSVLARRMESLRPREGVARTLAKLRESGARVGVASDFPVGRKLETLGIEDLVDFKVDPGLVGYLKPDKRCFDYLADCAKISHEDRARLLYVGDSFEKDILGAADSGLSSVLLGRSRGGAKAFGSWADFDNWLFGGSEV